MLLSVFLEPYLNPHHLMCCVINTILVTNQKVPMMFRYHTSRAGAAAKMEGARKMGSVCLNADLQRTRLLQAFTRTSLNDIA